MDVDFHLEHKARERRLRFGIKLSAACVCILHSICVVCAVADCTQLSYILGVHNLGLNGPDERCPVDSSCELLLGSRRGGDQGRSTSWPPFKLLNSLSTLSTIQDQMLPVSLRANRTDYDATIDWSVVLKKSSQKPNGKSDSKFSESRLNEKPSDANPDVNIFQQFSSDDPDAAGQGDVSSSDVSDPDQSKSIPLIFQAQDEDESSGGNLPDELLPSMDGESNNRFDGRRQASTKVYRNNGMSTEDDEDIAEAEEFRNNVVHKANPSIDRYYDDDNLDYAMEERQGIFARLRPRENSERKNGKKNSGNNGKLRDAGSANNNKNSMASDNDTDEERSSQLQLVYRYFGKSSTGVARSRVRNHLPFIVLSPSVAYWKKTGTILSSKGYSVIACEISTDKSSNTKRKKKDKKKVSDIQDGAKIVKTVLNTLKWKRAIVVGNDGACAEALQAALELGPDRVAGLILCGDLRQVNGYAEILKAQVEDASSISSATASKSGGAAALASQKPALDEFIEKYLYETCPSMIVWDGDLHTLPTFQKGSRLKLPDYKLDQLHHRHLILGGGSSPHRRLPEQFSWVVSRFVEEHIASASKSSKGGTSLSKVDGLDTASDDPEMVARRRARFGMFRHLWSMAHSNGELIGATVTGRVVAALILYLTAAHVFALHYQNVCCFIKAIRNQIRSISSWSIFVGAVSTKKNKLEEKIRRKSEKLRRREMQKKKTPKIAKKERLGDASEEEPATKEDLSTKTPAAKPSTSREHERENDDKKPTDQEERSDTPSTDIEQSLGHLGLSNIIC